MYLDWWFKLHFIKERISISQEKWVFYILQKWIHVISKTNSCLTFMFWCILNMKCLEMALWKCFLLFLNPQTRFRQVGSMHTKYAKDPFPSSTLGFKETINKHIKTHSTRARPVWICPMSRYLCGKLSNNWGTTIPVGLRQAPQSNRWRASRVVLVVKWPCEQR